MSNTNFDNTNTFIKAVVIVAVLCLLTACGGLKKVTNKLPFLGAGEEREIEFIPKLKLDKVWSHSIRADKQTKTKYIPLLQGNAVFVADKNGTVSVFGAESGKRIWKQEFDVVVSFALGGGGEALMLGTDDGRVIAFSSKQGKPLWNRRISNSAVTAISSNHRGVTLVRTADGSVSAVASSSGKQYWKKKYQLPTLSLQGMSVPLMFDQYGLLGLDDGRMLMVDLENGRSVREVRVGLSSRGSDLERIVDIDGQIKIYDRILYASSYKNRTIAFDLSNYQVQWDVDIGSYAGLDVDENHVYITQTNGSVIAVNRYTGSIAWSNDKFFLHDLSAPLALGKFVLVGDEEGAVYWLSAVDGTILARYKTGAKIDSPAIRLKQGAIVFNRDGGLLLLRVKSRLVASEPK